MYRQSAPRCKNITLIFIFACIAAVAGLLFAIAFADLETKTFLSLLGVIGACFIVATFITAYFAGLEEEEEDDNYHGEDKDNDPPELL